MTNQRDMIRKREWRDSSGSRVRETRASRLKALRCAYDRLGVRRLIDLRKGAAQ